MSGLDIDDGDRQQAEVFDALSHPTRIKILIALSEGSLGFSDLKKKLGIESNGHLQHHLNKLGNLLKTDDFGKYTLSDQGRDALHSVEIVKAVASIKSESNTPSARLRKALSFKYLAFGLLALLLITASVAAIQYNNTLDSKAKMVNQNAQINTYNSTVEQRDTMILELDTAFNLSQSLLNMNLPAGSQYLTMSKDSSNPGNQTKIYLQSVSSWYHYEPAYPFNISWFNSTTGYGSSIHIVELTDNRSIPLSFFGWDIGDSNGYEYEGEGGNPYLLIGLTIRNDYTSADSGNGFGAPIGNQSSFYQSIYHLKSSYASFVNLALTLYDKGGNVIQAQGVNGIQSPTAMGGVYFPLGSGETKQVVFYLNPGELNIDHLTIQVSYLSSSPPTT